MAFSDHARSELLTRLLREVSRSFYLTLRVLPCGIRAPIGLAYLLARIADTIADTELIPVATRLDALRRFRICVSSAEADLDLGSTLGGAMPSEQELLRRSSEALELLNQAPLPEKRLIQEVVATITGGQELDLVRFAGSSVNAVRSLDLDEELDDYTYRVAGCVGEFWTRICAVALFRDGEINVEGLIEDGVRFGKGLQRVNILRDLRSDLAQGRCYMPARRLEASGLTPEALLDSASEAAFRPLYESLLREAAALLGAGWNYTCALPRRLVRVRLACAWPVLIGMETLELLAATPALIPGPRVKVSRSRVRRILFSSLARCWSEAKWRAQFSIPPALCSDPNVFKG